MGTWREGNEIAATYIIVKEDLHRVGNCWMNGRLLVGDIVVCMCHSGDCFYNYRLLRISENACESIKESEFGSYTLLQPLEYTFTPIQFAHFVENKDIYESPTKLDFFNWRKHFQALKKQVMEANNNSSS